MGWTVGGAGGKTCYKSNKQLYKHETATNCGDYKLQITNSKILLEKNYDKMVLKVCLKTDQSGNLTKKSCLLFL